MRRRTLGPAFVVAVAAALAASGAASAAPAPTATTASAAGSSSRNVFYTVGMNVGTGEPGSGLTGGVGFTREVGGITVVDVFLSEEIPIPNETCPDGSERVENRTLRTPTDTATEPGPVMLDIDRRLSSAEGSAVVDLLLVENAGCGAEDVTTVLPARLVSMSVTGSGTGAPLLTGIGGTVGETSNRSQVVSYRFVRNGTAVLDVEGYLQGVVGDVGLVYGVDRSRVHGTPTDPLSSAAPPGGEGASGFHVAEYEPPGGLGIVYEDAFVFASTSPSPERATTVGVDSLRSEVVACEDGTTASKDEFLFGSGVGSLDIGRRLSTAAASATVTATHLTFDGCRPDQQPLETLVELPVLLDLSATGPVVRVRNFSWLVIPGETTQREEGWYESREAAGTLSAGALAGTAEGMISRAGP